MKNRCILITLLFIASLAYGQQRRGYAEWVESSRTDVTMLPMYGHKQKSEEQNRADAEIIKIVLEEDKTPKAGSDHLIELGFSYANEGSLQTAMSRFNQAWLVDSTNSNVFWGFGAVYFYLQAYDESIKMYQLGLAMDSLNTNLLTDLGAIYLAKYNENNSQTESLAMAISFLERSYRINPNYSSTVYKLIICSLYSDNCDKAKMYFKECDKLEKNPITEEFRKNFEQKCK